jgi:Protein of unknown function (DUF3761)
MDAAGHSQTQSVNIAGNGHHANVAQRDVVINHFYPAPPEPAPEPVKGQKRRAPRGWLRPLVGGALAVSVGFPSTLMLLSAGGDPGASIGAQPLSPPAAWPTGMSALCNNGEFSASHSRAGTCSGNAGVAFWRYPRNHAYWRGGSEA